MISEKMRIAKVKMVENIPTRASPYTSYTNDPTIEAPMVFAMVLIHRMAEIGLSEFCLSFLSLCAPLLIFQTAEENMQINFGVVMQMKFFNMSQPKRKRIIVMNYLV